MVGIVLRSGTPATDCANAFLLATRKKQRKRRMPIEAAASATAATAIERRLLTRVSNVLMRPSRVSIDDACDYRQARALRCS